MISFEDTNVLGQLIETTWGQSSTGSEKYKVPAGRSIKANIFFIIKYLINNMRYSMRMVKIL